MSFRLEFVDTLPDIRAFEALMVEYYQVMAGKVAAIGGPVLSAQEIAADTIAHLPEMTPPDGRLLLAISDEGALIGCGVIRRVRPDAAELKRMYVRPEAQGLGLGRQLFEMRINEARRMGCTTLYADTVKGNRAMLAMYEGYGFRYIPRYAENANGPKFEPWLVYLEYRLD
ncbi:GNAT family N-acetyltransferase [Shimia abyssi]|uniref:Acetyltransferase (GNAT) family protein n=1 Tax=Shimia abyssi TaxID=1662395 RepID=A0A2P8FG26_9RHOB|nr:GNAT family N-acetyltransferase [Shimia abyssi]PSL20679.1 acetyltransferase (GNAT) family protein [Shimia abyssi]